MFESLTEKFNSVFRSLSGRGRITEANISDAMREVRKALLEADVNYNVVKKFCKDVAQAALGAEVIKSLHPGQVMVKIVNDELTKLMGPVDTKIYFVSPGPTVIMLAGLQGGGKTTTAAKLAKYLVSKGKKPLLVADDLQRPAAIDQLIVLGQQLEIDVYSEQSKNPVKVARNSLRHAKENGHDVVVLDTAGRLHVDAEMMDEVANVAKAVTPHQIYLVCDAMTGQDAVNSAKEFNERLELDGVILTKLDGDARGGAALSVKAVTGKPIKFIGIGEKLDKLEEFHPDRMASRILGMGDVVSLVEKAQEHFDADERAGQAQHQCDETCPAATQRHADGVRFGRDVDTPADLTTRFSCMGTGVLVLLQYLLRRGRPRQGRRDGQQRSSGARRVHRPPNAVRASCSHGFLARSTIARRHRAWTALADAPDTPLVEAAPGLEPGNCGFADRSRDN